MSDFPHHLQPSSVRRSPRKAWMVVLFAAFALIGATLMGIGSVDAADLTIASAAAPGSGDSGQAPASEQAPEQGESPSEGDDNLEEERENLVFLEPSTLTESVFNGLLQSTSEILLPFATEPRGIEKPPRA